jgi:hypothetical protein
VDEDLGRIGVCRGEREVRDATADRRDAIGERERVGRVELRVSLVVATA